MGSPHYHLSMPIRTQILRLMDQMVKTAQPSQRVDAIPFDNHFTCNCSNGIGSGTGTNCATFLSAGSEAEQENEPVYFSVAGVGGFLLLVLMLLGYSRYQLYRARHRPEDFTELEDGMYEDGVLVNRAKGPPYEILRKNISMLDEIGKGNFGKVFKAIYKTSIYMGGAKSDSFYASGQSKVSMEVAVKTLTDTSPQAQAEFMKEALVTNQFDHENVCRMLGVVTVGEPYLLVLELCSKGSLKSELTKLGDTVDEQLLMLFVRGIVSGMAYLAGERFVHRDLAARNVLLNAGYEPKVADFGMSRATETADYYTASNANGLVPMD